MDAWPLNTQEVGVEWGEAFVHLGLAAKKSKCQGGEAIEARAKGLKNYYFPPRLRANTLQEIR